ncbi:MAG: hypothetical protein ACLQAH_11825 [Limisphaerales bacterium]
MNPENLIKPEVLFPERKLRLFSLYVDFAAAVRARWATSQISRLAGEPWRASTEMWNLDSVAASQPIRKMITQDAADADVLVVAMSSLDRRELELVQWLDAVAACKVNRPVSGLFIGLLGDDNHQMGELDWTVKQFIRCAQRTDRDFIWHWMEKETMDNHDWLPDSVTALLTRKQPPLDVAFWPSNAVEIA